MNSSYEPNDLDKSITILIMTDNLEVERGSFSTGIAQWGGCPYKPANISFTHHLKGTSQQEDINTETEKVSLPYLSAKFQSSKSFVSIAIHLISYYKK